MLDQALAGWIRDKWRAFFISGISYIASSYEFTLVKVSSVGQDGKSNAADTQSGTSIQRPRETSPAVPALFARVMRDNSALGISPSVLLDMARALAFVNGRNRESVARARRRSFSHRSGNLASIAHFATGAAGCLPEGYWAPKIFPGHYGRISSRSVSQASTALLRKRTVPPNLIAGGAFLRCRRM